MSDMSFRADRLSDLMKRRKLNDGKLAYMSEVSRTMIYYLRKGERTKVSGEILSKLADALNTSTQYLMGESDDPSPNQKKMSALVADIVDIAEKLSPSKQQELRELGRTLLQLEKSVDVNAAYNTLMEQITRLAEIEGGEKALDRLLSQLTELSARPPSTSVPRNGGQSRQSRSTRRTSEPPEEPSQSEG